jgi:phage tail-like protein
VEPEQRPGAGDPFPSQVPVRFSYTNVTLSRRLTADTAKVSRFLAKLPAQVARSSARITAVAPEAAAEPVLATWALREVVVVRWTGPSYDPAGAGAATESIELAHQGFL